MADDCLFCRIASGDIPAQILHRDDEVIAFRDVNPQAPTHVLVIPVTHIASLGDLVAERDALWCDLRRVAQALATSEGIDRSGYRLVINCGAQAGQTVDHLHLHLLGGRAMGWPPG